ETINAIWNDMSKLSIPSWVSIAPTKSGSTEHGKLSADHYRSLCSVNLPYTLGRLWGNKVSTKTALNYPAMYSNFMDLVSAVKIAMMRNMTASRIDKYNFYMKRYLQGLLSLYKGVTLSPTHHLVLHFGEQLANFGPVHSWRCFPFERYNGLIQKISTNKRFGELDCYLKTSF
ncbi:hypothetical protein CONPUDRAFT_61384, partial [Coniophora puteana RWD-64-598 SS2]